MIYRTDNGFVDVRHEIEELVDIDELVERGPHWDTLVSVTVTRNPDNIMIEDLTVEKALLL
jgi:hypothetical protein